MFNSNIWPILAHLRDISLQNGSDLDIGLQGHKVKCDGTIKLFIHDL